MQRKIRRQMQRRIQQKAAKALWTSVAAAGLFFGAYGYTLANPSGGTVTNGEAAISGEGTSAVTITQATNTASLNWTSFSIGSGESVTFVQPGTSSIAVNRVIGTDVSAIYGTLFANGKVFLINPNGILFSPTAQVNVGGIVASTLNISDSDLENGNDVFSGDSTATVSNAGTIIATDGGYVVLLGRQVSNSGTITTTNGTVALGAGSKITLDFDGDGLLSLTVDSVILEALAKNSGKMSADGGKVFLSAEAADALGGTVVNNSGIIQAQSISDVNGTIVLDGGTNGTVTNSGTLDASGTDSGEIGGTVKVLGETVSLASGTQVDVSGDAGGGITLIGGNYQGGGTEQHATTMTVAAGATINADALTTGDGGTVVVWSDDMTSFAGTISAKGGSMNGDGGLIETSSKGALKVADTASITTTAANGSMGTWLLDPADITIGGSDSDISVSTLATALTGSNVTIMTDVSSATETVSSTTTMISTDTSGNGDITLAEDLSWSGTGVLTLSAYRNIYINADITITDTGTSAATGHAGLDLEYGAGGSGDYSITGGKSITFSGNDPALAINSNSYTIIDSTADLVDLKDLTSGYYALGTDIDLSGNTYTSSIISSFSGILDGLGHTISNLTIESSDGTVGLIGQLGTAIFNPDSGTYTNSGLGTIKNLGLEGGSVSTTNGYFVGGLVGHSYGTITDCYTTGNVSGVGEAIGGLVGSNDGTITDCYTTVNVSGKTNTTQFYSVGGLVGINGFTDGLNATITGCYATGDVSGSGSSQGEQVIVGGLVGMNGYVGTGTITDCYATGNVSGFNSFSNSFYTAHAFVGGLVGYNKWINDGGGDGVITDCYAAGDVTGTAIQVAGGGLVGINRGEINNSYATGAISVGTDIDNNDAHIGGLVGWNYGTIEDCYATGNAKVEDSDYIEVGGLAAFNSGTITNSYATGDVSGTATNWIYAGGLVGRNSDITGLNAPKYVYGTITDCYATGKVTATGSKVYTAGLSGLTEGTISATSRYDTTKKIISGNLDSGAVGKTIAAYLNNKDEIVTTKIGTYGFYYLPVSTLSSGDLVLLCVNSSPTACSAVYYAGIVGAQTKTLTHLDLTSDTLTVGSLDATAINNSMLGAAYNSSSAAIYSVNSNNLTVTNGYNFQTTSGTIYEPGGNVTTINGTQTYNGPVALTTATTLTGNTITFNNTVDGVKGLSIDGDAVFSYNVGEKTPLSSLYVSGTTTLNGNHISTSGAQTYNILELSDDTTLVGSAVTIESKVDEADYSLTIEGNAALSGIINLSSLNVGGTTTLNGNISTVSNQEYTGALTLLGDSILTGDTITFGNAVEGNHTLGITGDAILKGNVGGTTADTALTSLNVSETSTLYGNIRTSGAQEYTGAVTLVGDSFLTGDTITFKSAVDGAKSLTINGDVVFNDNVGNITALLGLDVNGSAKLNGNHISTSGAQTYNVLELAADTTLTGNLVTIESKLDEAAYSLTIDGSAALNGDINLSSLNVGGTARLNGNITTVSAQEYTGAVTLAGDSTLTGDTITFKSTVDGAKNLTVDGGVVFNGNVGGTTALSSLSVSGATTLYGNLSTSGIQTYGGTVTLNGDITLESMASGGDIMFIGAVSGSDNITVNAASAVVSVENILTAANNVLIKAADNITIGKSGSLKSTGGDVTLVSTQGHFINNSDATDAVSASDRWLIYTVGASGDTIGNLTYDFTQYGNYGNTITASGNGFIYSTGPQNTPDTSVTLQNVSYTSATAWAQRQTNRQFETRGVNRNNNNYSVTVASSGINLDEIPFSIVLQKPAKMQVTVSQQQRQQVILEAPAKFLVPTFFDFNSALIREDQKAALDNDVQSLEDSPNLHILIGGHADQQGERDYNSELSRKRAQTVADYLINNGVDPSRITIFAYGEDYPEAKGEGQGWLSDRWVDIAFTKKEPTVEMGIRK
jgi:filamentous hemagglutinin family protein